MQVCSLDHFHYFYLLIYQLEWYVGEAESKDNLKKRFKDRARKWGIPPNAFDFLFYIKLEVPKRQTPRTCEQGLKDTIEGFVERYVPSGYNFSCANLKECAPTSYSDLFTAISMVSQSGAHKGKTLQYFINKQFPPTLQTTKSLTLKPLKVEYGKAQLPSVF